MDVLSNPHGNGILIFILGMFFVLSIYHFLLYLQNRNKSFLLYSLYTFTVILGNLAFLDQGFIYEILEPWMEKINLVQEFLIELYYIIYIIFAYQFVEVYKYSPKWYKAMKIFTTILFFYCITILGVYLNNRDYYLALNGYLVFTVIASLFGILSYIPFFRSRSNVKYYLISGSLVLLVSSLTSLIIYLGKDYPQITQGSEYVILYAGLTIEIIIFALGLGHVQSLVLKEKNDSQAALIDQLIENEKLKEKIRSQLETDLSELHKQIEEDKLKALKSRHKLEVTDLKLTALRSQMNPHFIFNSLNSIKLYIINNDKKNAVHYLNKFSKLIRKILSATREKETSVKEEIETMELYVMIENIRFNGEINFHFYNDENLNLSFYKIPSLILQPFIENAIWHGLSNKKNNKNLTLKINKCENHIIIIIIDDGIGLKQANEINQNRMHLRESVGINLSKERLTQFAVDKIHKPSIEMGDAYPENQEFRGTRVTIKIPLS